MRLVVLILLLSPGMAWADPVSIGTFLSSTAFSIGTFAVSWGSVIFTVGSIVYGQSNARKQQQKAADQERLARAAYNDSLNDRTISGVATESPWKYVYGVDRAACNPVAIFTSGDVDQYKHIVAWIAPQQSQSIDEIYLNKQAIGPLDADGNTTGGPFYRTSTNAINEVFNAVPYTLGRVPNAGTLKIFVTDYNEEGGQRLVTYTLDADGRTILSVTGAAPWTASYQATQGEPMVRVIKHLGAPGQTVDTLLQANVGATKWPNTARLEGLTYIYMRLNLNQPEFQGGIPQMEALLHGKIVRNVRTDVMEWSENPADCIYDYLISELGGVKESSIPMAGFISTANDCDDIVSTGSWTGKRYTFNGTVTSDQSREDVLEQMAQSMAGGIVAQTWDIYAGKYSAPVMSVDQADIVGEIALSPGLALNDVFNTVRGQYLGAENNYIANDYQPYSNPTYLDADGEELVTNINFAFTNSQQRCTNLARIAMEDSRNAFSMTGKFSLKLWSVKVGQRISFTSSFFGQTNKVFRLTDKSFAPDKSMTLSFKEDAESIYDLADETEVDATPNTGLPNPFAIEPLDSLTLESGDAQLLIQDDGTIVSRILATWPMSMSPGILQNGVIQIEYLQEGQDIWQKAEAGGSETSAYLSPVSDGLFYTVRARPFNPYLNAWADWVYGELHRVIGKTEPPPDVETFTVNGNTFTWSPVVANDLAGYQTRFNYGQNFAWGIATPLHTGLITESPWTPLNYPSGQITVLIKAQDTTGNQSQNAAFIQTNLGDPIVANLIFDFDDKAAGFTGTVTNGSVVGGDLVADDSGDLFWGPDLADFWGPDGDLFWPTSTYEAMTYVLPFSVGANEVGSRLTLLTEIDAQSFTIEYRVMSPGIFWGPDGDFFWGADADLFWEQAGAWQTWPGALEDILIGDYELRITTLAGTTQGAIRELTLQYDVVDETEFINDVAISALGTRLTLTKSYRSIKNVQLTLQTAAGGADHAETADKTVNGSIGPLVYTKNGAALTTGLVDAFIQGVKGN